MATKRLKHRYLQTLGVIVLVLALLRVIFPSIGRRHELASDNPADSLSSIFKTFPAKTEETVSLPVKTDTQVIVEQAPVRRYASLPPLDYVRDFPDSNYVQLDAARQWGVSPVKDREDAEMRKSELVYMGSSPYYDMAVLTASIPYLVPRASILLQDIGRCFIDSLMARQMPLHRIVVSSVLRSEADISRLRQTNKNATEQSCHLYGTTFDINYTVFTPATDKALGDDVLKRVLGEVLRNMRMEGRCYIKHEVRQPCFHITVR